MLDSLEDRSYDRIPPQLKPPAAYNYYHRQATYGDASSLIGNYRLYDNDIYIRTPPLFPYDDHQQQHSSLLHMQDQYCNLGPEDYLNYDCDWINRKCSTETGKYQNEPKIKPYLYLPEGMSPPLPPIPLEKHNNFLSNNNGNNKKKLFLKSSLSALKNVFRKTTRPLRRMNSLVEPLQPQPEYEHHKLRTGLRRQHSMLERGVHRPFYPDEYPMHPPPSFYSLHSTGDMLYYARQENNTITRADFARADRITRSDKGSHRMNDAKKLINCTYQNHEEESIYSSRLNGSLSKHIEDHALYSNRAIIAQEKRQFIDHERMLLQDGGKRKSLIRRHSTTTADQQQCNKTKFYSNYARKNYPGSINPSIKCATPTSEIMTRRRFSPVADNEILLKEPSPVTINIQRREPRNQTRQDMQEKILHDRREIKKELNKNMERGGNFLGQESVFSSKSNLSILPVVGKDTYSNRHIDTKEKLNECGKQFASKVLPAKKGSNFARPEQCLADKEKCVSLIEKTANATDEKKEEQIIAISRTEENDDQNLCMKENSNISSEIVPLIGNKIELKKIEKKTENVAIVENKSQSDTLKHIEESEKEDKLEDLKRNPAIVESDYVATIQQQLSTPLSPLQQYTNSSQESSTNNFTNNLQTNKSIGQLNTASALITSPNSQSFFPRESYKKTSPLNDAFSEIPRESTTSRGIFDSSGGTLVDHVWNVSLYIPPGALAEGVQQEIYFTVSDPRLSQAVGSPPLDMENGLCFNEDHFHHNYFISFYFLFSSTVTTIFFNH